MKKLKFIMVLTAAFITSNLVVGANPIKNDLTVNLADKMVKTLCRDIVLTDSQKVIILASAKEYERKMKSLKSKENSVTNKSTNKHPNLEYRALLNQILTQKQIDTLSTKRTERLIKLNTQTTQK